MTHVITQPCIGTKSADCVEVCPVNCIHDGGEQFYIDPDVCIDCGACVPVCPVDAIFAEAEVPAQWAAFTGKNAALTKKGPAQSESSETEKEPMAESPPQNEAQQVLAAARTPPATQGKQEKPAAATPAVTVSSEGTQESSGDEVAERARHKADAPADPAQPPIKRAPKKPPGPSKEERESWDPMAVLPIDPAEPAPDAAQGKKPVIVVPPKASPSAATPVDDPFEIAARALDAAAAAFRSAAKRK